MQKMMILVSKHLTVQAPVFKWITNIKVGSVPNYTFPPLAAQATGGMVTEATNEGDRAGGSTSRNESVINQIPWGNTLTCVEYKRKWNGAIT